MSSSPRLPRFGAHVSIAGGHHKALQLAHEVGCEIVQVFTKNNMQWSGPPLSEEAIALYEEARRRLNPALVFAHSGYLINLCATKPDNLTRSRESLLDELTRCNQLDLPFLVLHPGAHLGVGEEAGLALIRESLTWVLERAPGQAQVALEVTAGAGSVLGGRLEHLATIMEGHPHAERLSICLDTCHLFAAGYDLRGEKALETFLTEFDRHLPWEKVVSLHLNDSKGALGSHLDRHDNLGRGQLGWETFLPLLKHPRFAQIPFCLETPKGDKNQNDIQTLRQLKALREDTSLEEVLQQHPLPTPTKKAAKKTTKKKSATKKAAKK